MELVDHRSVSFVGQGFYAENGWEYINRKVAQMLQKLRTEQTKSRSRHNNDNAMATSKNASVLPKHFGYSTYHRPSPSSSKRFTRASPTPGSFCSATACSSPPWPVRRSRWSSTIGMTMPLEYLSTLATNDGGEVQIRCHVGWLSSAGPLTTDLATTQAKYQAKAALFVRFKRPR